MTFKSISLREDKYKELKKQADEHKMGVAEYIWFMVLGNMPIRKGK